METGTLLPGFGKLKPVPVPVHTRDTLSQVYPYPCHALNGVVERSQLDAMEAKDACHALGPGVGKIHREGC